jgi:molybdopterin converting factor small subunit
MRRRFYILLLLVTVVSGCGGPSAKEKYDAAVQEVDRAQAQLDKMRPAYDAAAMTARNAVCREITGTSPEESETATVGDVLNQLNAAQPDEGKKADGAKPAPAGKKGDELDKLIDSATAAQKDLAQKQASLAAPIAKLNEVQKVMNNIKTPGTPEAKKFEEKLAAMPEVKAYQRQQRRLEIAQKDVEEAEKDLPGGAEKSAEKK